MIHTHRAHTAISIDMAALDGRSAGNIHDKIECVEHSQDCKTKTKEPGHNHAFHGNYDSIPSMSPLLPPPPLRSTPSKDAYDSIVIGSGPNGLAAAITLARAGKSVLVVEANDLPGGGARSMELTLPGFTHDVCSAIHPMGIASPFFRSLPLHEHGLEWIHAPHPLAHPFDDGTAVTMERNLDAQCAAMGKDGKMYKKFMQPFLPRLNTIFEQVLGPLKAPRTPLLLAKFGMRSLHSAKTISHRFQTPEARALIAGLAAHSVLPLEQTFSAGIALALGLTLHGEGWPLPRGGSQQITWALIRYLQSLGGEVVTGIRVTALSQLPKAKNILFDTSPRTLIEIAGDRFRESYKKKIRAVQYGPSVFKLDWALDAPIPWTAEGCRSASTIHVGGTFAEIAQSERDAWQNRMNDRPFLIVTQPSLFDDTRAPHGKHTAWAYCHVPHGSEEDMTDVIEEQIERFAPGFKKIILARSIMTPADVEAHNANNVGGDITGGVMNLRQLFKRPTSIFNPYNTPDPHLFLCSSSTPPGGGVHGMCGHHAALAALR